MIDLTQKQLLSMIISALVLGVVLGVVYEGIRLIKLLLVPNRGAGRVVDHILTFVCDIVFVILLAITGILQTYKISGGVFRGLSYIGMLLGLLFYRATLGQITKRLSERLAVFVRRATLKILKIIFYPVRKIFSILVMLYGLTIGKIIGKIISGINKRKAALHTSEIIEESTQALPEGRGEEIAAVQKEGYKKEGRISLGPKRAKLH